MNLSKLYVKRLFGLYDYSIDFSRKDVNFTVLTSPNGYGKTTLLRIINSLDVRRLYYLYLLKFSELYFFFEDGSELVINEPDVQKPDEKDSDTRKDIRKNLCLTWKRGSIEICRFDYVPDVLQVAKRNVINKLAASRRFGIDVPEDSQSFFTYGEGGEALNTELANMQGQEQFLLQLATMQTDFIGANRIYTENRHDRRPGMRVELPVLQVVRELRLMLSQKVAEFQSNFQRLDTKLIEMLLDGEGKQISQAEYQERAARLQTLIEELNSFGLTNKQSLPFYRSDNSSMLDVYLLQMEEKLRFYKDLLPLVQLFDKNIRQKHFANKTITLSPQHGLRIVSDNGDILSADMLSTGEQNQIVLLYDLIFKTPKGSILLIDEPEGSLHVAWQNDFVNDMRTIAENKELQIVVATHSAIIVSNTPDEQVFDLYYLQKG